MLHRKRPEVAVTLSLRPQARPVYPGLRVEVNRDGSVTIHADAITAALLAGRSDLGDVGVAQAGLRDLIADGWYAADCPVAA